MKSKDDWKLTLLGAMLALGMMIVSGEWLFLLFFVVLYCGACLEFNKEDISETK